MNISHPNPSAYLDPRTYDEEAERREISRRVAQRLEAVGQLAAGIAHEINTPVQYVNDSIHFLARTSDDLLRLCAYYRERLGEVLPEEDPRWQGVREAEDRADLEYVKAEAPLAFERVFDGINRVRGIVQAMKEFAHPDTGEKSPFDLNKALKNTLIVAKNEYKYVADIESHFGDIPAVVCRPGDINQVFLNLIVNAAHAVAEVAAKTGSRGTIRIATASERDHVVVTIEDTGTGIPDAIKERVFDPFFTTKEVGKGTGQGLAIARSIVVDKHGGTLHFETTLGQGTVFSVRLPVEAPEGSSGKSMPGEQPT